MQKKDYIIKVFVFPFVVLLISLFAGGYIAFNSYGFSSWEQYRDCSMVLLSVSVVVGGIITGLYSIASIIFFSIVERFKIVGSVMVPIGILIGYNIIMNFGGV
jgi:hypothetical protein